MLRIPQTRLYQQDHPGPPPLPVRSRYRYLPADGPAGRPRRCSGLIRRRPGGVRAGPSSRTAPGGSISGVAGAVNEPPSPVCGGC